MTALFTIDEDPVIKRTVHKLEAALDCITIERAQEHENRHVWDRADSRGRIRESLVIARKGIETMLWHMDLSDQERLK